MPVCPSPPPQLTLHLWPSIPNLRLTPPTSPDHLLLLEIPDTPRDSTGRNRVRASLQSVLREWTGRPVALEETPFGPRLNEPIQGQPIHLSITYASGSAWVGFRAEQPVGIDALSLLPFDGWEEVARLYLPPSNRVPPDAIPTDFTGFARAWTSLEASLKAYRQPLREDCTPPPCRLHFLQTKDTLLAVALPRP